MMQSSICSEAAQQSIWNALPLNPEQRLSLLEIMKQESQARKDEESGKISRELTKKDEELG